jgi:enterochelin esterase family protein
MIAQGLAEPMIIVMPYANPLPALLEKNEEVDMNVLSTDYFTDDLINDVLPFTENNYSVYTDAGNRAIAGFSLGGRQTLAAGLGNPDKFSWVCAFSPAIFSNELENNFKNLYASPASLNSKLKLLWVSCGKDDGLYDASVEFTSLLEEKGIRHRTFFSEGGHTWMNCRLYLSEIAKLIFN